MSQARETSKLWGGRFSGGLDPDFERFNQSLRFDARMVFDDLRGSVAWAHALARAGVLTEPEALRIVEGLAELEADWKADDSALADSTAEDVHTFVEAALGEKVGQLAKKLHTGRSRNDQVATDLKLYLRREVSLLLEALRQVMVSLTTLAERTSDLPLPGYTHLQRAQPITAGHHALAYVEMLARDAERLCDALERSDTCPLGAAALAGTTWPVDRDAVADQLDFHGGPARNSLDAVSDRDHVLEVVFACVTTMLHLSRLAEDWIFFASQEAGFLRFGDSVSTGSSLMPQKRNPDAMELLRGKTGRVVGDLQALIVATKGLPMAYNKDLQEDKEALFDALETTRACLRVAAVAIGTVTYDEKACRAACVRGHLDATDLADLLVDVGVPFREAHERVGEAVTAALEQDCTLAELHQRSGRELFPELGDDLFSLLSVEQLLGRRAEIGGTAPERVRAEVERWQLFLARGFGGAT